MTEKTFFDKMVDEFLGLKHVLINVKRIQSMKQGQIPNQCLTDICL